MQYGGKYASKTYTKPLGGSCALLPNYFPEVTLGHVRYCYDAVFGISFKHLGKLGFVLIEHYRMLIDHFVSDRQNLFNKVSDNQKCNYSIMISSI